LGGVEPIGEVRRRNRLRWFGHVERKEDDDWVKRCTRMEVVGKRTRGRPRKTWMSMLKDDMKKGALSPKMRGTEICGEGVSMVQSGRPGLTWKCYRCCFTCGGAVKPTCVCVYA
jgi:hypothetical protein